MDKIKVIKSVANFVVGLSTGAVARSIIHNNTNPETVPQKAAIGVGSVVLGSMVADASKTYTDAKIDEWHAALVKAREPKIQDS